MLPGARTLSLSALVVAALVLAALGCGSEGPPAALSCGAGPPEIDVAAGLGADFGPVADGGRLYVRCGGQGLRHIQLQVRASGVAPLCRVAATLVSADTGEVYGQAGPPWSLPFHNVDAGEACESPTLLLIVGAPSTALADKEAILTVGVTDSEGRAPVLTRRVIIDTSRMACSS